MSSSRPTGTNQDVSYPGEHEIKKWVREAVKPLLEPIRSVVDGVESAVHTVEHPIESLAERYLGDVPADIAKFGDLAQNQVLYWKRLQTSFIGAYTMLDNELQFDSDKGAKLRKDLLALVGGLDPIFTSMFHKLALDDGPVQAFKRFSAMLSYIPNEILGALSILADLVSFDSLVKAMKKVDDALASDPFAAAPAVGSDAQRAVLGGIVVLSLFANALEYVISIFPATVSISGEGGASVGVQAEVGAEAELVSLVPAVLGLIAVPCRVGMDGLSGYLNIIS
jgi:hypothetical protein